MPEKTKEDLLRHINEEETGEKPNTSELMDVALIEQLTDMYIQEKNMNTALLMLYASKPPGISAPQDLFVMMVIVKMMNEDTGNSANITNLVKIMKLMKGESDQPQEKNELMEIVKAKLIIDALNKKEIDIDTMIKLMQAFGPKEDKTLEYLKQQQELARIEHENERKIAEEKKEHEKELRERGEEQKRDLEALRKEIIDYRDKFLSVERDQSEPKLNDLSSQLDSLNRLESSIKKYVTAMRWGQNQNLPELGEKWTKEDYSNAINLIGQTIGTTIVGITNALKNQ